jgi:hypothetical protein
MDLVRIGDAAENAFVKASIGADSWTGANDQQSEGSWVDRQWRAFLDRGFIRTSGSRRL